MSLFLTVPHDYGYLPQSSLPSSLHRLMDGCHGDSDRRQLTMAVLESVTKCSCELPPCNWSHVVVPYLRSELCEKSENVGPIIALCMQKLTGFQQLAQYCTQPLILSCLKVSSVCGPLLLFQVLLMIYR